jgi:calpain-15
MVDIKRFSTEWKRARDFTSAKVAGGEPALFKGGIDPNDIKQGMLGDCYFVAALATLAEWPDRVKKIFVSEQANG